MVMNTLPSFPFIQVAGTKIARYNIIGNGDDNSNTFPTFQK